MQFQRRLNLSLAAVICAERLPTMKLPFVDKTKTAPTSLTCSSAKIWPRLVSTDVRSRPSKLGSSIKSNKRLQLPTHLNNKERKKPHRNCWLKEALTMLNFSDALQYILARHLNSSLRPLRNSPPSVFKSTSTITSTESVRLLSLHRHHPTKTKKGNLRSKSATTSLLLLDAKKHKTN